MREHVFFMKRYFPVNKAILKNRKPRAENPNVGLYVL